MKRATAPAVGRAAFGAGMWSVLRVPQRRAELQLADWRSCSVASSGVGT